MHFGKIQLASLVWINLNLIKPETHSHFSTFSFRSKLLQFSFFSLSVNFKAQVTQTCFLTFSRLYKFKSRTTLILTVTARKTTRKIKSCVNAHSYVYFQKMLVAVVLFQIIDGKEIDWSKFPHRPMVECECAVNVQLRGMSFSFP